MIRIRVKTKLSQHHLKKVKEHATSLLPGIGIFIIALIVGNFFLEWFYANPTVSQVLETFSTYQAWFLYQLQANLGINLLLRDGTTFIYPNGMGVIITPLCIGFEEIILFSIMVLCFIGPSLRTKLIGIAEFSTLIILLNQFRILMLYPVSLFTSPRTAWAVHDFIFQYVTVMVLAIFFVLWYGYYVLLEEKPEKSNEKREIKKSKLKNAKKSIKKR